MRILSLNGFLRIGILALVLMVSAGPVNAQLNTNTRAPTTATDRDNGTVRTTNTDRDENNDWGWIGLLGLLGLAGLLPKKRTIEHDRVDTGSRTMNR
jgi:hypothetical protein